MLTPSQMTLLHEYVAMTEPAATAPAATEPAAICNSVSGNKSKCLLSYR